MVHDSGTWFQSQEVENSGLIRNSIESETWRLCGVTLSESQSPPPVSRPSLRCRTVLFKHGAANIQCSSTLQSPPVPRPGSLPGCRCQVQTRAVTWKPPLCSEAGHRSVPQPVGRGELLYRRPLSGAPQVRSAELARPGEDARPLGESRPRCGRGSELGGGGPGSSHRIARRHGPQSEPRVRRGQLEGDQGWGSSTKTQRHTLLSTYLVVPKRRNVCWHMTESSVKVWVTVH